MPALFFGPAPTQAFGVDGLYATLGQPFNVPPRDELDLYKKWGVGGIVRMNAFDGSQREVYATGVRNSVGQDFNPKGFESIRVEANPPE